MKRGCKWIRPESAKPVFKSALYTNRLAKLATIEMSEDDCEKYYGTFYLPGTDLTKDFVVMFAEDLDDAERIASRIISEQCEDWIDVCQLVLSNLSTQN